MPAWLTIMANPSNKAKKVRKAPSAKQRANWARFAAMSRARAKGKSIVVRRTSKPPRASGGSTVNRIKRIASRAAKVVVRRSKSGGSRAMLRKGFTVGDLAMQTGGVIVGMTIPGKVIDYIPWPYIKTGYPRIGAKFVLAGLLAGGLYLIPTSFTRKIAGAVMVGGTVSCTLDVIYRNFPNAAPGLSGDDDSYAGDEDDGVGEMVVVPAAQLAGDSLGSIGPSIHVVNEAA